MKLVVRISNTDLAMVSPSHDFVHAIAELLREKHSVTMVHGRNRVLLDAVHPIDPASSSQAEQPLITSYIRDLELMAGAKLNKTLVAMLGKASTTAVGLFGSDGNIVRTRQRRRQHGPIRKVNGGANNQEAASSAGVEVASVEPFWLDVITKNGGVPVIANFALGPDDEYYCIDADQLAASCAVAWNADALIFLTREEGIRSTDGSILRWVNSEQLANLLRDPAIPQSLLSKLGACNYALRHGVRRARILPIAKSESLASFYFTKIEWGTEVILAA
ncbi:MAG TPA: acetylglutamate kinase [Candidatus Angelobacter sp.]|nr:acetylglutamate kinase [Candidatus Angelobacter sp.]